MKAAREGVQPGRGQWVADEAAVALQPLLVVDERDHAIAIGKTWERIPMTDGTEKGISVQHDLSHVIHPPPLEGGGLIA